MFLLSVKRVKRAEKGEATSMVVSENDMLYLRETLTTQASAETFRLARWNSEASNLSSSTHVSIFQQISSERWM